MTRQRNRFGTGLIRTGFMRAGVGVLLAGFVFGAVTCAEAGARVYVRIGPPAPRVDVRVVSPGPRYVYVPGYYRNEGRGYAWVHGGWVVPPRPRAVWVAPRWVRDRRHGWYFVEGYWR
jgi:WXXGXW repeat (2 copies)